MIIKSSKIRFAIMLLQFVTRRYYGETISGNKISLHDFFTPYILELDSRNQRLTIHKRNWYFVGVDRKFFNFGQIRNFLIDEHILLGDIQIQVYAGKIYCYWMKKSDLREFQKKLLELRSTGTNFGVIVDEY